jgi:hypothetical protein
MITDVPRYENQIHYVYTFQELVSTPFNGMINAICWKRNLTGDYSEIANKITLYENITEVDEEQLHELQLSEQGIVAREILLNDLLLLRAHGAAPVLNLIKCYDRDTDNAFFPTDVYSFHADRSPVPVDTFLCTYYGDASELISNAEAQQKVLLPDIRNELKKHFDGDEKGFENYLSEHFYDLHYSAKPTAKPFSLGVGNLWKLAVEHPESKVTPCIHRAPLEKNGQTRLLMIC